MNGDGDRVGGDGMGSTADIVACEEYTAKYYVGSNVVLVKALGLQRWLRLPGRLPTS